MFKFKKKVLALSLASVLGVSTTAMAESDKDGVYIRGGGGLAIVNAKDMDHKPGYDISGALGYKKNNLRYEVEGSFIGVKQDATSTTIPAVEEKSREWDRIVGEWEDGVPDSLTVYEDYYKNVYSWEAGKEYTWKGQTYTFDEDGKVVLFYEGYDIKAGKITREAKPSKTTEYSIDDKAVVAMANIYYDFDNSSKVTPFVGAGIGYANVKEKTTTTTEGGDNFTRSESTSISKSKGSFAYQGMVGAKYEVAKNADIDLTYRILGANFGSKSAFAQTVNLGVSYRF